MYKKLDFDQFVEIENPYGVFVDFQGIEFNSDHKEKYLKLSKYPVGVEDMLKDLQLLGKREVSQIIKWRDRVKFALKKKENIKKVEFADFEEKKVKAS